MLWRFAETGQTSLCLFRHLGKILLTRAHPQLASMHPSGCCRKDDWEHKASKCPLLTRMIGMSQSYSAADEDESIATIHRAFELGVDFFDTAEVYGPLVNKQLVGRTLKGRRAQVVTATARCDVCPLL
jgi:Aldo/keto reductase family